MTDTADPDRAFALTHAPHAVRPALAALWALDERLGRIVATTTQPMVGQMRLTWWHDALTALRPGVQRGEPVLDALAAHVVGCGGIEGAALTRLVEGWEELLDPLPLDGDRLRAYADLRGVVLFALSAQLLGGSCDDAAGRGWALADFALRCSDDDTAARARAMAVAAFASAHIGRLPRPLRALSRLAAEDMRQGKRAPRTIWRLLPSIR